MILLMYLGDKALSPPWGFGRVRVHIPRCQTPPRSLLPWRYENPNATRSAAASSRLRLVFLRRTRQAVAPWSCAPHSAPPNEPGDDIANDISRPGGRQSQVLWRLHGRFLTLGKPALHASWWCETTEPWSVCPSGGSRGACGGRVRGNSPVGRGDRGIGANLSASTADAPPM